MALDSILPIIPPPPKSAAPASSGSSSNIDAGASSFAATATQTSTGPETQSSNTSSTTGNASGNGPSTRSASATKTSSTAGSQAKQGSTAAQAQSANSAASANAAANAKNGSTTQPRKTVGPTFVQALAQSQADAEDSAEMMAAAAPQEITGGGKANKSKAKANSDSSDASPAPSLASLSQSLAAAMAAIQPPAAIPASNQPTAVDPTQKQGARNYSTAAVSPASGSSVPRPFVNFSQSATSELNELDAITDTGETDASETNASVASQTVAGETKVVAPAVAFATPATPAPATDSSPAAVAHALQAINVSTGSHLQQTASTDVVSDKVNAPVGTAAFNDELGAKITWMVNQDVQSASLQLSPEHLGPVEVRISVQNGSASVSFNANQADTRAALEQALPRLREMFATQGLVLSDASVSQQAPRGQPQKQAVAAVGSRNGSDDSVSSVTSVVSTRSGLVDIYA